MANVYDTLLTCVRTVLDAIDPPIQTTITRQFPTVREGDVAELPLIVISPRIERLEIFSGEKDEAYEGTYPIMVSIFSVTPDQINDTLTVNDYRQTIRNEVMKWYRTEYDLTSLLPGVSIDNVEYDPRPAFDMRGTQAGINVSNQLFTFRMIEPEE